MNWLCRALLRYRRDGSGVVAEALSDDPDRRKLELALVARATDLMMKALRPAASATEADKEQDGHTLEVPTVTTQAPESETEPTARHAERKLHFRQLGDNFMRDAQRDENSLRTRTDCAFEAVYLYALSSVDAKCGEHPNLAVLVAAAKALQLTDDQISPALDYADKRYSPTVSDTQDQRSYDSLLSLAQLMRKAT